jgi:homoserine dehydrogenase
VRTSPPTVVLKFGSSVLRGPESLPIAVAEAYRHYRTGARVIAVVSAFEKVTDGLCAAARAWSDHPDPAAFAALVSTGEIVSATQLTLALQRAGIPARFVDPRDVDLSASGERGNAELTRVAVDRLRALSLESAVLVIPGFFGKSDEGGIALLGRGGSDLTALYLAHALQGKCILLKDVDGLYESDPARRGRHPGRFIFASYQTADRCSGPLMQAKAVRFARERKLAIEVARVGSVRRTQIFEGPTILDRTPPPRRIRVALLGLGNVGAAVLAYLNHFPERFELVAVLVRTPAKHADRGLAPTTITASPEDIFVRNPEVLVEALSGTDPAAALITQAVAHGVRVVTANKAVLAANWAALATRLAGPRRQIRYAAAVGGAVPMLELIERLSLRTRIARVRAVLNGTSNFVLDCCAAGDDFASAVRRAQDQGFAEADPSEDLSGRDTARKLEVLGRVAFGGIPQCEQLSGISPESALRLESSGQERWRLVAEAQPAEGGFTYSVKPRRLHPGDYLAATNGSANRLEVHTVDGRLITLDGAGAGGIPTATAVFADLLEHARVIEAQHSESGSATVAQRQFS